MEYDKKDWQRSEGRYRNLGKDSLEKDRPLSAYRPSERERSKKNAPHEMMTMESSYGRIAFGSDRQQKMTMVVHEKRTPEGPGLKRDNREVDGDSAVRIGELRGDIRTNSHSRKDSAFVYKENLQETPFRMMERLQEMMDENYQRSGQKVLPFLSRKEDQAEEKAIREQLRNSVEKGNRQEHLLWSRRREDFLQEKAEKEEMYRNFYRQIRFVQEKAKRLRPVGENQTEYLQHDGLPLAEENPEDGNSGENNDKKKKNKNED